MTILRPLLFLRYSWSVSSKKILSGALSEMPKRKAATRARAVKAEKEGTPESEPARKRITRSSVCVDKKKLVVLPTADVPTTAAITASVSISETVLSQSGARKRKKITVPVSPATPRLSEVHADVGSSATISVSITEAVAASVILKQSRNPLKFVGAHTSIAGGPASAIIQALSIGAHAFGLFVRSARTWKCPPLSDEAVERFKTTLQESQINPKMIVAHGSYLINPGSADDEALTKAREGMLDEMQRCEKLGIPFYNIHPGSTCGKITVDECTTRIAESVDYVLEKTSDVMLLLENMAGQGSTIGGKLEDLAAIISKVKPEYKPRVGICLDTCHAFAAGFDISTEEGWNSFMDDVSRIVGLDRLKAFHLNDSMFECGAHRDRHAKIGKGLIGVEAFRRIMSDPRTSNVPLILETHDFQWKEEIDLLYSLCSV